MTVEITGRMKKIAAAVYANEVFPTSLFESLAVECRARRMVLTGVLQFPAFEGGDHRCDVVLEDLMSGHRTTLFDNRGAGAKGCRLDQAAFADVAARIEGSLEAVPDLLVLNKYGKLECEGGGFRNLIASAIERDIAVTIGVPQRNLPQWREFVGRLAEEIPAGDPARLSKWVFERIAKVDA